MTAGKQLQSGRSRPQREARSGAAPQQAEAAGRKTAPGVTGRRAAGPGKLSLKAPETGRIALRARPSYLAGRGGVPRVRFFHSYQRRMAMTTKQALAELKKLAKDAAVVLYRRIELAALVLSDLDWIARTHDGSDLKAQDALQGEFFRDLSGYVTLGKLLAMYRHIPEDQWRGCRYDVAAVEVLYDDQAEPDQAERGKRTAWKALAEERGEALHEAEAELVRLRKQVAELKTENERLRGRIEQLERLLGHEPVATA